MSISFYILTIYLIEFIYEYLSGAAIWCNVCEPKKWLEESKEKWKLGRRKEAFQEITNKYASLNNKEQDNGLTKCYRYRGKRLDFINYQSALVKGLPIG